MFKSKKKREFCYKKERKVRGTARVLRIRNELSKRLFFPRTKAFFLLLLKKKTEAGNLDLRGFGKHRTRKYRYEREDKYR